MTNYREILRLNSLGLNNTQIAQSCACSRTTVIHTLHLAREKGLSFPLPEEMSDKQLAEYKYRPQQTICTVITGHLNGESRPRQRSTMLPQNYESLNPPLGVFHRHSGAKRR